MHSERQPSEHFQTLLAWLGSDRVEGEDNYLRVRAKLVRFFAYRGSFDPEELADETIARVAKKVPDLIDDYVGDPGRYFLGVARNVHHEYLRRPKSVELDEAQLPEPVEELPDEGLRNRCLNVCLGTLAVSQRELILAYYEDDRSAKIQNRRRMAEGLGVGLNALRIKAFRIRTRLQKCVVACVRDDGLAGETFHHQGA